MELAEALAALPQAEHAVQEEEVSLGHARELARLHARAGRGVQRALADGAAADLLAAGREMDVPTFAKHITSWATAQDPDAAERTFAAAHARRYLRTRPRDGGGHLEAFLDPIALASVRTALEAFTSPPTAADERTADQRAADALAALANSALSVGPAKIGAQIRPHISLLVPADTWTRMRRGNRAGPDGKPERVALAMGEAGDPVPAAELDDGTPMPGTELERLACDCEVTRIVLDADGIPLDVGQTQRTYAKGLRRAVLVRDGTCRWPGCTLPGSWCEVHHVAWFSRGGSTSLANGLTLCTFHHRQVHRHRVRIRNTSNVAHFTHADGTPIGTSRPSRRTPSPGRRWTPQPDGRPGLGPGHPPSAGTSAGGLPAPNPESRASQAGTPPYGSVAGPAPPTPARHDKH
jgi:hypothetical protein